MFPLRQQRQKKGEKIYELIFISAKSGGGGDGMSLWNPNLGTQLHSSKNRSYCASHTHGLAKKSAHSGVCGLSVSSTCECGGTFFSLTQPGTDPKVFPAWACAHSPNAHVLQEVGFAHSVHSCHSSMDVYA